MATQYAKRALQNLTAFKATKWFTKDFKTLALRIATDYAARNEINYGLADLAQGATFNTSTLKLTGTAGVAMINGVLKVLPALSDTDVTAIVTDKSLRCITSAGAVGTFDSSADVYVTLLATNSDGDATQTDLDNSFARYVAILGSSTGHLSSAEISAAILASAGNASSADHSGCKYVMVAQIIGKAATTHLVTLNRNNVLGA